MRKSWVWGGVLAVSLCACGARAQSLLVANQRDHNVSVLDAASGKTLTTIAEPIAGEWGHEVAVSADGRTAYLPIYGNSGVGRPGIDGRVMLVIDVPSRKVVRTVDFGHAVRPHLPVLDAEHHLLYVTTELDEAVTVIDTRTLQIVGKVPTGAKESHMLAISPDGRYGYTANVGPGSVSVLNLPARKTLAVIPVSGKVQRISISPDGRWVFTADQTQPRLAAIDTGTRKVVRWVALSGTGYGSAVTADGRWLLIAIPAKNVVDVVDLQSMRVARSIPVAQDPQEVLIRPDGKMAYVSCAGSGQVAAIDLAEWKVDRLMQAGTFADGLGWANESSQ